MIAGCGQVGQALLGLRPNGHFTATYRLGENTADKRQAILNLGAKTIAANLNNLPLLRRLSTLAQRWIWLAPPNAQTEADNTLKHLVLQLARRGKQHGHPPIITYISTTGVYGQADGAWINERTPCNPQTARAKRRVHAEQQLRTGLQHGIQIHILRAPGIYSANRLPLERIRAGTPVLLAKEDAYSNHIHEIDLARLALWTHYKGGTFRKVNACDQHPCKMGDYFDSVADAFQLPRPPRLPRDAVKQHVSEAMWSFMQESRKIASIEQQKLQFKLRYPSVNAFLKLI